MTQFVTNDVIATDAVNATSIAAGAVGASELATDAVGFQYAGPSGRHHYAVERNQDDAGQP